MATSAHCFYCFECLSASFENREPPSLEKVEDLWEQYELSKKTDLQREPHVHEKLGIEQDGHLDDHDEQNDQDEDAKEHDVEEEEDEDTTSAAPIQSPHPQHPSISRLQAPTPESRSSNSSTPSIFSVNSSNSALTNPSSISSPPSNPPTPSYTSRLSATATFPLFVTWNTISHKSPTSSPRLRGCIGTFDPLPLSTGLQSYALTSAFDDTRFSPIPPSLLSSLSCALTLLSDFETCADALDWTLGQHGIRISFMYKGRRHGATYLPDVAVEQGWDKEETVESLMRKAGWDGGSAHSGGGYARRILRGGGSKAGEEAKEGKQWEQVADFKTVRYSGLRASASYVEWKEWRNWVERVHGETALR